MGIDDLTDLYAKLSRSYSTPERPTKSDFEDYLNAKCKSRKSNFKIISLLVLAFCVTVEYELQ